MGNARWTDHSSRATYDSFTSSTRGRTTEEIYSGRGMNANLNPYGVKVRESRDSVNNPKSTPIIVALDVTGSMGMIADNIARGGLGVLFTGLLDRKPVSDPHLMFMGVGDANFDSAPLQVSQFEADARIVEQLAQLFLEHGGGGNDSESYHLPWYFGAFHTVHDAMEKRGRRGYLFTVGDECAPEPLRPEHISKITGDRVERSMSAQELLSLVGRVYDTYHIVIEQGSYARGRPQRVRESWTSLMGQKVIFLPDYEKLAETVVTAIQVAEGHDPAEAAREWGDAKTAQVVHEAVARISAPGA